MTKTTALRASTHKAFSGSRKIHGQSKSQHGASSLHPLLQLQQSIGNREVARLIQAKRQASEPEDACERRVSGVADRLMRLPEGRLQRNCAACASGAKSCPSCDEESSSVKRKANPTRNSNGDSLSLQQHGASDDLKVQRTIGNERDLSSPRFAGDPVLEAVFDNERVLKFGSNAPEAIAKVQQALIDAGFAIPNGPTGGFGPQTKAAVIAFQKAAGLEQRQVDGIIGPNTMSRLDSRFPTAEAPAPSTNCEQGFKTVTVDIVSLRDASGDPVGDLAFANDVFRQCCVQFVLGTATTVSPELSDRLLGGDTDLQMAGCGNVAQEELDTFLGATAEFGLSSRIKVFYVASMTPSNQGISAAPLCATGPRAPLRDMVVVMNGHNRRTLAHEFGHILMNTFADHSVVPNNLLHISRGSTGERLEPVQCAIVFSRA